MTRFTLTEGMRKRPSIADHTVVRSPEDRSAQVEEWLDLLRGIKVDTSTALADTHAAIGRATALATRARDARKVAADEARAAARHLASDPEAAPRAAVAVEDYSTALGIAQSAVWATFVAADLAGLIGPAHKAAVKSITTIAAQIPPEVGDITAAARARCSDSWVQLEESIVEYEVLAYLWCDLHAQHAIRPGPGVVSGRRRVHTPADVLYAAPLAAIRATAATGYAGLAREWKVVYVLAAGKPVLGKLTGPPVQGGDLLDAGIFDAADELRERHKPGTRPGPRPPSAMAN